MAEPLKLQQGTYLDHQGLEQKTPAMVIPERIDGKTVGRIEVGRDNALRLYDDKGQLMNVDTKAFRRGQMLVTEGKDVLVVDRGGGAGDSRKIGVLPLGGATIGDVTPGGSSNIVVVNTGRANADGGLKNRGAITIVATDDPNKRSSYQPLIAGTMFQQSGTTEVKGKVVTITQNVEITAAAKEPSPITISYRNREGKETAKADVSPSLGKEKIGENIDNARETARETAKNRAEQAKKAAVENKQDIEAQKKAEFKELKGLALIRTPQGDLKDPSGKPTVVLPFKEGVSVEPKQELLLQLKISAQHPKDVRPTMTFKGKLDFSEKASAYQSIDVEFITKHKPDGQHEKETAFIALSAKDRAALMAAPDEKAKAGVLLGFLDREIAAAEKGDKTLAPTNIENLKKVKAAMKKGDVRQPEPEKGAGLEQDKPKEVFGEKVNLDWATDAQKMMASAPTVRPPGQHRTQPGGVSV